MNRQDLITEHHALVRRHTELEAASKMMLKSVMALMIQGCRDENLWASYQVLKNAVVDAPMWKQPPASQEPEVDSPS
jgi:hypothetical protein